MENEYEFDTDISEKTKDALAKEIRTLVLNPSIKILPTTKLAKKYNVSNATILSAKNKIILGLPKENVEFVKKKFAITFDKLEQLAEDLINNSEDNEDLRKNIDLTLKIIKEKTDYLERFHIKKKATENINATVTTLDLSSVSTQILNDLRREN